MFFITKIKELEKQNSKLEKELHELKNFNDKLLESAMATQDEILKKTEENKSLNSELKKQKEENEILLNKHKDLKEKYAILERHFKLNEPLSSETQAKVLADLRIHDLEYERLREELAEIKLKMQNLNYLPPYPIPNPYANIAYRSYY